MAKRNKENRRVEHALPPRTQRFSVLPPEEHDPDDYSAIPREKHDPAEFSVLPPKYKRDRAKQRRREVAREKAARLLE